MVKLFIDTNLWLRYFIADSEEHTELVDRVLQLNKSGKVRLSTSTFVLSEFVYTQQSYYRVRYEEVVENLEAIAQIKNIVILERTDFQRTLDLFKQRKNNKWSDCVIAAQVPENYSLCSFDQDLEKLIGKKRFLTPVEAMSNVAEMED